MTPFAKNLRQRAEHLGFSNAEVARRAGLLERTYGNYVLGRSEPDFKTFMRIAEVLGSTPNELLSQGGSKNATHPTNRMRLRLSLAGEALEGDELDLAVMLVEAIAERAKTKGTKPSGRSDRKAKDDPE